ncbi:PIN domain-like protein [Mycena rosella]|uniref:PIN domain-like protein n=1 Tax=Mycena rosella TaxID=1033263 RepID=A0AAD7D1S2_MYCRO|nr:PIN domain-like protein [Mycena rosella]
MGIPKLWEIIGPAAQNRSLLNLATIKGFQNNHRGLRTLIIGVDIRQVASILPLSAHPEFLLAFESMPLFYQLCNFSLAPMTLVFVFDGPGRPSVKRGTKVVYRPAWLEEHLKTMITNSGYYYYDVPGEVEAELRQLNHFGKIDGIISEDSDTFVFGGHCVIRTQGFVFPLVCLTCSNFLTRLSIQDMSWIYTSKSIETTAGVSLDKDGIFLCTLLLGGDYHSGIEGAGPTIARALARQLAVWCSDLREELRSNSSGHLPKRQPKLAMNFPDTFPDLDIARLYLDPLTSRRNSRSSLWKPMGPSVWDISDFCSARFSWHGADLLKKLHNNLWPGATFRFLTSVRNKLYSG